MPRPQKIPYESSKLSRYARFIITMPYKSRYSFAACKREYKGHLLFFGTDYGRPKEKTFTTRPKINSHYQISRYGRSIFCLRHRPNFSDIIGCPYSVVFGMYLVQISFDMRETLISLFRCT